MWRKFRYLFCMSLCMYFHSQAQYTGDSLLHLLKLTQPGLARATANPREENFSVQQAYAIKTNLPHDVTLLRVLPGDISIVRFRSTEACQKARQNASVFFPVNDKWKLSPTLLQQLPGEKATASAAYLLSVDDITAFEKKYKTFPGLSIKAVYPATGSILLHAPSQWLTTAGLPDTNIYFIANTRKPVTERELTGFDLSANKVNAAHRIWPGINGQGLTLSIKENKMDTTDIDFRGRYVFSPAASPTMQTHATTMATIAAGGGNSFYTGRGVAWGASISSSDFANLLPDNNQQLQQLKVSVQNHSYGVGIENYYGADAAAYDAQLYQQPSLLHIFSAGNSGNLAPASGSYAGLPMANLTGSFKMAKNVITVASTDSFGTVSPSASHGPAYDGRLKPELVALGEDGSSGAAAIVSGVAILVQHAWQQKKQSIPPSSLTRAVLLNSASDVGNAGIDFFSGYGSVNAVAALRTIADERATVLSVPAGQTTTHSIVVPANARNLKITLCWTDPPAQSNTLKALLNDLDLMVFHRASATSWLPWVLNSYPAMDSLLQLPLRKRDSLNNTEQVTVPAPPGGVYEIMVKAFALGSGTQQEFSIAWQYDTTEHFIFTYPVKNDNLFPKQTHTLRWETSVPGTGALHYRVNTGNWKLITPAADLSRGYYQWQAPDTTGALQLRMMANNKVWLTDTLGLAPNLAINTGYNCTDSFLVYWQRAAVDSYRVYRLGNQYLELFATTADTAILQSKLNNPFRYFTVAPVLPGGIEGARSYAFDYTQQQTGCYINSFVADPSGIGTAKLSLTLGTVFRVSSIVFERLSVNGFVPIDTISPVTDKQHITTQAATKGLNTYRARVIMSNGSSFYTQPEQVLIFGGQSYYVFPNPLRQGSVLRFLSDETDNTVFVLYDLQGRKIIEYKVSGYSSAIRLPLLQKGTYYYTILTSGVVQLSSPLIIL